METQGFLQQLAADGDRLATVAAEADPAVPVPGLAWTVGEVVTHVGGVHRWCADLVRERRTEVTRGSADFAPGGDVDLEPWLRIGLAALLDTLRATPADVEVWGFGRPVPAQAFWSRRQAHETAIHRADVEAGAARPVTAVDPDFAQDGLDEITFFAGLRRRADPPPGRLGLRATDGDDRLITVGGERIVTARAADAGDADAVVTGTSSELYLWAWNRPSTAVVAGDPAVVAAWQDEVQIS